MHWSSPFRDALPGQLSTFDDVEPGVCDGRNEIKYDYNQMNRILGIMEVPFWHRLCNTICVDAHSTSYVCLGFINLGMTQSHFTVPVVQPANIANVLLEYRAQR